jgi:hypothetical protein
MLHLKKFTQYFPLSVGKIAGVQNLFCQVSKSGINSALRHLMGKIPKNIHKMT